MVYLLKYIYHRIWNQSMFDAACPERFWSQKSVPLESGCLFCGQHWEVVQALAGLQKTFSSKMPSASRNLTLPATEPDTCLACAGQVEQRRHFPLPDIKGAILGLPCCKVIQRQVNVLYMDPMRLIWGSLEGKYGLHHGVSRIGIFSTYWNNL